MKKKITESTASSPLGNPVQARLFRVASGEYAGRRAALLATAPGVIALYHSDTPGTAWSAPLTVTDDSDDHSFDAVMMPNGDIHLVYPQASTNWLMARKLTYESGTWSVGDAVTVYSGTQCYDPSLAADVTGCLWVGLVRYVTPTRSIYVKASPDGGATWGSGPEDVGDQILASAVFAGVKLLTDSEHVHAVYYSRDGGFSLRSRALSGGEWSARQVIVGGNGFNDEFDAAAAGSGRLGLVYYLDSLYYCEFDGAGWSVPETVTDRPTSSPQLRFIAGVPAVTFLQWLGTDAMIIRYSDRRRGVFGEPVPLDRGSGAFDSVLLYHAATATFEDRTSEAANSTVGDLFHPASGQLLESVGDALYLGMDTRFSRAHVRLSTPGAGGTVRCAFWNGLDWQAFVPADGAVELSASDAVFTFWDDYDSLPANWQKTAIAGLSRFWIRLDVQSPFTTAPLGDQITSATWIVGFNLRR